MEIILLISEMSELIIDLPTIQQTRRYLETLGVDANSVGRHRQSLDELTRTISEGERALGESITKGRILMFDDKRAVPRFGEDRVRLTGLYAPLLVGQKILQGNTGLAGVDGTV